MVYASGIPGDIGVHPVFGMAITLVNTSPRKHGQ